MPPAAIRGDPGLLERDGELEVIASLLARVRSGEGALLVIEGQAGVGKTELLRTAGDLGDAEGLCVLRTRGSELDRAFAFGMVRQLLERVVAGDSELLSGGAEPAASVFAAADDEARAEEGIFSALQGLHWLVVNLAARGPLMLLADDVHWADRASLRWLVFLAERLEDVNALLVVATRPAEPGADQELLDALMAAQGACVVRPAPLSEDATTAVVRGRLPQAGDAFGAACHRATGGNPFLLGELLGELAADGVEGAASDVGKVLEFGSEGVGRAVRRRLRGLAPEATSVARAVAVLGPGAPLEEVASFARADQETAARAGDALVSIHVLAAGLGLEFVHPVVRAAVYEQIPPLERQMLHAEAAELLTCRGAESERVARRLLRLPPAEDPARVAALRAAARGASARGDAGAAAHYLRRAVEEPPTVDERGVVLHELGVAEATDRQRDRFDVHLREAMAAVRDARLRAEIALDLGRARAAVGDFRASAEVLEEALRGLDDPEGELGVALEGELMAMGFHEFTSTELAAPYWNRRLAQLDAGEELKPTQACRRARRGAGGPARGARRDGTGGSERTGGSRARGACRRWRSSAPRPAAAVGTRVADRQRGSRGGAGRGGSHESGDRAAPVRDRQGRRMASAQRLPQARRRLAPGAPDSTRRGALGQNPGVGPLATRALWWWKILAMSPHHASAGGCLAQASTYDAPPNVGSAISPGAAGSPCPSLHLLPSPPPRESRRNARPRMLDPAVLSEHIDALYRAARAMCGSMQDAEDLVQETFAQVLKRPRFIRDGNEKAYLMRALKNTYANGFRTAARRPATRELFEHDAPSAPDSVVDAREIMEAIATVPAVYRDAVIAVDLVGLSYREAARSLGTREATFTTRLHRGRQHIARALAGPNTA